MTPPCIICEKPLESAFQLDDVNQPYAGTCFQSPGHFGSTVFDPMDGSHIEMNICDPCLVAAGQRGAVLYYAFFDEAKPWEPPAQGIEAGTDETPQEVRPEGQEPGRDSDAPNREVW